MAGKKRVDEGAKVRGCLCGDIDPSDRPCLVCEAAGEQAKVRGHAPAPAAEIEAGQFHRCRASFQGEQCRKSEGHAKRHRWTGLTAAASWADAVKKGGAT